jgi:hypothetical protein
MRTAVARVVADMDLHGAVRFLPDLLAYQWLGDDTGWSEKIPVAGGPAERAPPRSPGRFNGPHSVACGTDGRIYVTTYYDPGLHILLPHGELATRIDGAEPLFPGEPGLLARLVVPADVRHIVVQLGGEPGRPQIRRLNNMGVGVDDLNLTDD